MVARLDTKMSERSTRTRRHDPNRRDRIIAVALDVIAETGVEGVTHRHIASLADVSLGSMTYHFEGMDDLLASAFELYSQQVSAHYALHLERATNADQARDAVTDYLFSPFWQEKRNFVLLMELYSYVARHPPMRERVQNWLSNGRLFLERHFDSITAKMLDSFIEGVTLHRAIDPDLLDRENVRRSIERLTS